MVGIALKNASVGSSLERTYLANLYVICQVNSAWWEVGKQTLCAVLTFMHVEAQNSTHLNTYPFNDPFLASLIDSHSCSTRDAMRLAIAPTSPGDCVMVSLGWLAASAGSSDTFHA